MEAHSRNDFWRRSMNLVAAPSLEHYPQRQAVDDSRLLKPDRLTDDIERSEETICRLR